MRPIQRKKIMMIKYKAVTCYIPSITISECERETESSLWIKGRKHNKRSQNFAWFDTFEEAKAHLIEKFEAKAISAKRSLDWATDMLGNAKGYQLDQCQPDYRP